MRDIFSSQIVIWSVPTVMSNTFFMRLSSLACRWQFIMSGVWIVLDYASAVFALNLIKQVTLILIIYHFNTNKAILSQKKSYRIVISEIFRQCVLYSV